MWPRLIHSLILVLFSLFSYSLYPSSSLERADRGDDLFVAILQSGFFLKDYVSNVATLHPAFALSVKSAVAAAISSGALGVLGEKRLKKLDKLWGRANDFYSKVTSSISGEYSSSLTRSSHQASLSQQNGIPEKFRSYISISPFSSEWNPTKPECRKAFDSYELYHDHEFRDLMRTAPGYDAFILEVEGELNKKHSKLKERLKNVAGFETRQKWGGFAKSHHDRYGFHDFIHDEAKIIQLKREEERKELHLREELLEKQVAWLSQELDCREKELQNHNVLRTYYDVHEAGADSGCAIVHDVETLVHDIAWQGEEINYAKKWSDDASEYHYNFQSAEYQRSLGRLHALRETVVHNHQSFTSSYVISGVARSELQAHGYATNSFEMLHGTALQHHFHTEIISILHDNAALHSAYSTNIHITNISGALYDSMHVATHANCSGGAVEYTEALVDFCHGLLSVGKNYALVIGRGLEIGLGAVRATTQGIITGFEKFEVAWRDFIAKAATDPQRIVSEYIDSLHQTALALSKVVLCAYDDPEKFATIAVGYAQHITHKALQDPEQALTSLTSFVTECALNGVTNNALGAKFSNFSKALVNEAKLLATVAQESHEVQQFTAPITTITNKAAQVVKGASENIIAARLSIDKTRLDLVYLGEMAKNAKTVDVFQECKDKIYINVKHLFEGEIQRNNSIKGLHAAHFFPERIKEIVDHRNEMGVYGGNVLLKNANEGLKKYSTFFPDEWDSTKIIEKIQEAYNNAREKRYSPIYKNFGITGQTNEGMNIVIWFRERKDLQGNFVKIINSAYPEI